MRGYNRIIIAGHAGSEPSVRTFDDGNVKAEVSVATSEGGYTRKDGSKVEEQTQWHRIVFNKTNLAKVVQVYVKKGTPLLVEGRLTYRKFTNKDNREVIVTEILADGIQLLGGDNTPAEQRNAVRTENRSEQTNQSAIFDAIGEQYGEYELPF